MEHSDEYLLELAERGDGTCFGILVQRWERKIYGFIYRYLGSCEDARDLTQDTFTKAFQNLSRLTDRSRFSAWLYTIALNECRMRFRRQRRVRSVSLEAVESEADVFPSQTLSPEGIAAQREEVSRLRRAFRDLSEEQREVILMKEYQGLKFKEIADILGIPLSTVKSRMYLGLKTLRRIMEGIE